MAIEYEQCYRCKPPVRKPGCHKTCAHYLADKKAHDARSAQEKAAGRGESDYNAYRHDQRSQYQKRMKEKPT